MTNLQIDKTYIGRVLSDLLAIPSPTGYTEAAIAFLETELISLGIKTMHQTRKGALVATISGRDSATPHGITGHVDTLGAIVKEIDTSGRLLMSKLGSYAWNAVEGEGVTVICVHSDKQYRGTILPTRASVHVHGSAVTSLDRTKDTSFHVRLDEKVFSEFDVVDLGIQVGDIVAFDPRIEFNANGYIRSRHLDDKAGVVAMLAAAKALLDAELLPAHDIVLHFSNYEEVGHGASAGFPAEMTELISVDMAAVGVGQNSDEFSVGICVKDSGGPYHLGMRRKLVALAEQHDIPYKLDIYPYYGSDGEAFWRAGGDVAVGLLGPGVDASHSYERTHMDSVVATAELLGQYMLTQ